MTPTQGNMTSGFFIIDKPVGLTSHDVVAQVRRRFSPRIKVGHTGTLDPFATGILLITAGSATRLGEYTLALPKTYVATIFLGATSTTDDLTGDITTGLEATAPSEDAITHVLQSFTGPISQMPPTYAAIKVRGKKLYEYAREGQQIDVPPRSVTIYALRLVSYKFPFLTIVAECSSGTYIRALGRDIGQALHIGAYVHALRRTATGPFTEQKAIGLGEIEKEDFLQHLHPAGELVEHLPQAVVAPVNVAKFQSGGAVAVEQWVRSVQSPSSEISIVAASGSDGALLGIGSYDPTTSLLSPQKVLTT